MRPCISMRGYGRPSVRSLRAKFNTRRDTIRTYRWSNRACSFISLLNTLSQHRDATQRIISPVLVNSRFFRPLFRRFAFSVALKAAVCPRSLFWATLTFVIPDYPRIILELSPTYPSPKLLLLPLLFFPLRVLFLSLFVFFSSCCSLPQSS